MNQPDGLWVTENSRETSSQSITVKLDALIGKHLEIIHVRLSQTPPKGRSFDRHLLEL